MIQLQDFSITPLTQFFVAMSKNKKCCFDFVFLSHKRGREKKKHVPRLAYVYHSQPRLKCKKIKPLHWTYLLQRHVCNFSVFHHPDLLVPYSVFAHCQGVCRLTFSDPVSQFVFLYGQKMCLCVLEIILDYFQPLDAAVVLLYVFGREGLTHRNH